MEQLLAALVDQGSGDSHDQEGDSRMEGAADAAGSLMRSWGVNTDGVGLRNTGKVVRLGPRPGRPPL